MKNEQNLTIELLEKCYNPVIWDTCDKIVNSNLTDPTVGYYAYKLQKILFHKAPYEMNNVLKDKDILIDKMLEIVVYPMIDLKIMYNVSEMNLALDVLKRFHEDEKYKNEIINVMGKESVKEWEKRKIKESKTPLKLHQFELCFNIKHHGITYPIIIIRNGYLLKCLKDAEIKKFEELDDYNAVLIYNNANINGSFCSFVRFENK